MKYKTTRRPGKPSEARVTILELRAETPDEESALGKLAIELGSVSVPEPPPFKGADTKPREPKRKATLAEAVERINQLAKGLR
jgi:hypothetical protein